MTLETPRLTLLACAIDHLERMLEGDDAFTVAYGLYTSPEYIEPREALRYSIEPLRNGMPPEWGTYMFIHRDDNIVMGMGGFKGAPDEEGVVEVGYGIAPAYRDNGYAREAAEALVRFACSRPEVRTVRAHTLPEPNASTRILEHCGMTRVGEDVDPDVGRVWRWERRAEAP